MLPPSIHIRTFWPILAVVVAAGCGHSPTGPSERVETSTIAGDFHSVQSTPWRDSYYYSVTAGTSFAADVTFHGDYNDRLWIEVRIGDTIVAESQAQGVFDPRKQVTVTIASGGQVELRLWTDKCCTSYTGIVRLTR